MSDAEGDATLALDDLTMLSRAARERILDASFSEEPEPDEACDAHHDSLLLEDEDEADSSSSRAKRRRKTPGMLGRHYRKSAPRKSKDPDSGVGGLAPSAGHHEGGQYFG